MKLATTTEDRRTIDADQATIDMYAKKFGVQVMFDVPVLNGGGYSGPRANYFDKTIHAVPLADSAEAFWSTMHETGHIAKHHVASFATMFGTDPHMAEQEAQAWSWAVDHANRPLDDIGRTSIGFSLSTYLAADTIQVIGPNLRRMFSLVGPKLDGDLMKELFPFVGRFDAHRLGSVWTKAATANTPAALANAA